MDFKNLQWLLTQLVSFTTIMESQSYKTFITTQIFMNKNNWYITKCKK